MLKIMPGEAALLLDGNMEKTILVSDLHLGLEKELARKGFRVPSYSVKMVDRIRDMADGTRATRNVKLGDVKHSVGKVQDIDLGVLPWFFDMMLDLFGSVEVVPGNHDGGIKTLLPARVRLHPSSGMVLGQGRERVGVAHGHAWPSREAISTGRLVIGHSHFTYEMKDSLGGRSRESVWLLASFSVPELLQKAGYLPSRRKEGRIAVMPPFNRMVGGQPINTQKSMQFGPVLSSGCVRLDEADIFLTDGTRIS